MDQQNPNEINFNMVAVTKVEASGVEYAPGEAFPVVGIDRARWLERQGAAKFESSVEAASVEDGGQDSQPAPETPATQGAPHEDPPEPEAATGARRKR